MIPLQSRDAHHSDYLPHVWVIFLVIRGWTDSLWNRFYEQDNLLSGEVVADHTEKGWFIAWVDRDPETLAREDALAKKKKMEETDEEETMRFIERQAERARMREPGDDDEADGEPPTCCPIVRVFLC